MKVKLLFLFGFLSLASVQNTQAAFPVTSPQTETVVSTIATHKPDEDTGVLGILSFSFGVLSIASLFIGVYVFVLLFIPAIIFGLLGLRKKYRGLAITGLTLGLLPVALTFLSLLALASMGA
jgi:hypothetical protein